MSAFIVAAAAAVASVVVLRLVASRRARERIDAARTDAKAAVHGARLEAAAHARRAENQAHEESLELRHHADEELSRRAEELVRREERVAREEIELGEVLAELDAGAGELDERYHAIKSLRDRAQGLRRDVALRKEQAREELERIAGDTAANLEAALTQRWIEEARVGAAQTVRVVEHEAGDPKYDRAARRMMEIAVSRYQNHFLTERNISNIRVGGQVCELLTGDDYAVHRALEEVAGVQLHVNEESEAVRLEGLDGVGREIARRALARMTKRASVAAEAKSDPHAWAQKIRANLEREIRSLGKKAFKILGIPKSHPEIVELVGALNYRTSYTQNQWLHAVEASFLAGMMASEMGLDIKVARRATLMHDIGKALTHKIDGSHAVIGADIARRLGEDEIVANAIGAHHADEPPNSPYAHLVAAADAMSGARPGARREASEGFSNRVEDLERIGTSYRGVDHAHAVHGGRELRVYVDEAQVDDLRVVELSTEIAERIAEEMTFPGQIKITVIRALEAVSLAN